jgi:flagellar basal body-associated protein FliL
VAVVGPVRTRIQIQIVSSIKKATKLKAILLMLFAATTFKSVSEKVHSRHSFQPICLLFTDHTLQTFGNNCGKFQLKRLICSRAINFLVHAPIKKQPKQPLLHC